MMQMRRIDNSDRCASAYGPVGLFAYANGAYLLACCLLYRQERETVPLARPPTREARLAAPGRLAHSHHARRHCAQSSPVVALYQQVAPAPMHEQCRVGE